MSDFFTRSAIDCAGIRVFEIQSHAQLVAQSIESGDGNIVFGFASEFGAVRAEVRSVCPARVAARGVLNLDYFGAEACQN